MDRYDFIISFNYLWFEADADGLHKAYLDKCLIFQPDKISDEHSSAKYIAEEEMEKINRVYDVLQNPLLAREYHEEWLRKNLRTNSSGFQGEDSNYDIVLTDPVLP